MSVPRKAAVLALDLRHRKRRTRKGLCLRSWQVIADELRRLGYGKFTTEELADAVAALPIELHPLAPQHSQQRENEESWKRGWAEDFPGEPWPGMEAAARKIRQRIRNGETQ